MLQEQQPQFTEIKNVLLQYPRWCNIAPEQDYRVDLIWISSSGQSQGSNPTVAILIHYYTPLWRYPCMPPMLTFACMFVCGLFFYFIFNILLPSLLMIHFCLNYSWFLSFYHFLYLSHLCICLFFTPALPFLFLLILNLPPSFLPSLSFPPDQSPQPPLET